MEIRKTYVKNVQIDTSVLISEHTLISILCWWRLLPEHVEIYVYWLCYCVASCNRYLMLINHPTDSATCGFFGLFNSNHQAALRNSGHMYFHRTVRDRTATVWRRCSVDDDRWRCRPDVEWGPLVRSNLYLKKDLKNKNYLPKIFLQTVR